MNETNEEILVDLGDVIAQTKGSGIELFDTGGQPRVAAGLNDD